MTFRNTNSAESWEAVYQAFSQVNFTSFDFDTIRASLIDYLRIYYPEVFNDLIASSELIAYIESFAYVAEQLAYRVDMVAHENFITTAQRKQSILRLAKLISYKATRNIASRGLVKFSSISTTERVIDSRGVDISGQVINWNDPNNPNWKEQFTLVVNRVLTTRYGQPQKSFQVNDVVMDLYSLNADDNSFINGVYAYTANTGLDSVPMEVVPADLDENGPFEREPDLNSPFTIIYANDGVGDGSDYTGFLAFTKQGTITRIEYDITDKLPNRRLEFLPNNVNSTDVWVQRLNDQGEIAERWTEVDTVAEQNLIFNDDRSTRFKYEVDTLENDQIAILFGDGDFSEAPQGSFRFWMRQSINKAVVVQKNKVVNQPLSFTYTATNGNTETCALTFSLTTTLQNGAGSETIEHIRQSAPATYYAQNRMVNGQDYNTFPLRDPSILRLKTVNRTFAGQPKYIDWNDASGQYENVKLFGDDLSMRYNLTLNSTTVSTTGQALIDNVIEPLLNDTGVINMLVHIGAADPLLQGVVAPPRRVFIEDNRAGLWRTLNNAFVNILDGSVPDGSLKEKTAIQGLIDRHWYGEPLEFIEGSDNKIWAVIPDPTLNPKDDSRIYAAAVPRTIDGINKYPPGDVGSGLQPIADQDYFGLRYNPYTAGVGEGTITVHNKVPVKQEADPAVRPTYYVGEVWTIQVGADGETLSVRSNLRGTISTGKDTIGSAIYIQPAGFTSSIMFATVNQTTGGAAFEPGDAFVLDTASDMDPAIDGTLTQRTFSGRPTVNLNGWWEILSGASQLPDYTTTTLPPFADQLFNLNNTDVSQKQHSWIILIRKLRQAPSNNVIGYEINYRDLALIVESPTTKFWYNDAEQILDNETKKRVFDNIKVLPGNQYGVAPNYSYLTKSQIYDVVGAVKDSSGIPDFNQLSVVPSDMLQEDSSGDLIPDRLLQFETFGEGNYEYFALSDPTVTYPSIPQDSGGQPVTSFANDGSFSDISNLWGRRLKMPGPNTDDGLTFMWQHFTPFNNIIDPSSTNIHDAYVVTQGYYDSMIAFVRGLSTTKPTPPTPLELRNSYGYLLTNKMLADTVVFHPGSLRLMFGQLAEPQLRAKFKVVRSSGASLTNERVKEELLNVINTYFEISNWDFGETFYATELISLMHQRLPTEIASVVLVPLYSTNSFGDMFTVQCGGDEILQSAATVADIDVVEALTPTIIRQVK
jgi:hypothetical protein